MFFCSSQHPRVPALSLSFFFFPFLWISFNFSLSLSLSASFWKITRKFRVDSQDQRWRTSEQKRSGLRVAHYSMKRETTGSLDVFRVTSWMMKSVTVHRATRSAAAISVSLTLFPAKTINTGNRYSTYSYSRGTEFIETVWLIRYFPLKIVSSTPSFPSRLRNHIPLSREFHEIFWLN